MASVATRGPGRPRVFKPAQRRRLAKYMRQLGLKHGVLAARKEGIKVSLPTAARIADEYNVVFKLGRPFGS